MNVAVITLSAEGKLQAGRLVQGMPAADCYIHENVAGQANWVPFGSVVQLTAEIFPKYRGLVYIAPTGVVVRAIAPCIRHKTIDPAVVAVDVGARWAVSLLSGHEGGANQLALAVANILSAEPIISTTTEAVKDLIVGIGCRRGTPAEVIIQGIRTVLNDNDLDIDRVRLLSSVDLKADEPGLLAAAAQLAIPLRIVASEEIRSCARPFEHHSLVQEKVNLPAVAEPAALLAGRRTRLIVPRTIYDRMTVAVARESFSW